MKIEDHKKTIKESLEVIKESINKGLIERQRTIGFHCSTALANMLEIYLHTKNLIDPGSTIKHDFFSSERKALEKLSQQFENKEQILKLLAEIEKKRNIICYGKNQSAEYIEEYLKLFNRARGIFDSMGVAYE